MKPENLETAARFAKKRKTLENLREVLESGVTSAEVTVTFTIGNKKRQATIQEDTFNALMYKLVESEIANIDKFVEQL